jgi:hypothetical protein
MGICIYFDTKSIKCTIDFEIQIKPSFLLSSLFNNRGNMSAATKKKYVFMENENSYVLPNERQQIVKVRIYRLNKKWTF